MATVCLRADDGSPFRWEHGFSLANVQMTGVDTVGQQYGGTSVWYPYGTSVPPYYVGDPPPEPVFPQYPEWTPGDTPPHTVVVERAGDVMEGWCQQCRSGEHVQCADDATEHSPSAPDADDWCRCPCGQIKQQLLNEHAGKVRVGVTAELGEAVELLQPGGHYVQLNRKELNELIRKLKRAGAQAFGRDEW
jgi:hypothetical protein